MIRSVIFPQVVPFAVGDHFQRQLVVIAQENGPLAGTRDFRGLAHDVRYGVAVLLGQRHVHAGHEGKVERHVAFVSPPEIGANILWPLVGLGQKHTVREVGVHPGPQLLEEGVGLGEVFVVGALAFAQIRYGVQAQPVDAGVEPELYCLEDGVDDARVVEVQVRLVREETVPIVGLCLAIPGPVRDFRVREDDPRALILLVRIAPHVVIPPCRSGFRAPGALKPRVLVGGVIDDHLGDDADAAAMGLADEAPEVPHLAVGRVDFGVVRDVVPVVAQRRRIERQQPDGGHAQFFQVRELLRQSPEIADAIVVGIKKRFDVKLIDDRVLVP